MGADVLNCYNAGAIRCTANYGGGITGDIGGGKIYNSYNTGKVSGDSKLGGICGFNSGQIINCYNIGDINGTTEVGGIAGTNMNGTIKNNYSTGTITGTSAYIGSVQVVNIKLGQAQHI